MSPEPVGRGELPAGPPLVELEGISKRFPGVQALKSVSLTLRAGEIVGLAGENGCGKSTLMKILAGRYTPDAGTIRLNGRVVSWGSPAEALRAGIALTAQEVAVHPDLSVTENLLGGRLPKRFGFVQWGTAHRLAQDITARLSIDVDPSARLGTLPLNLQHMIAIAKTVDRRPDVLVLDEPTASLGENQVANLFRLVRELRDTGTLVVYITHRLKEYAALCDRIAVLRDGDLVADHPIEDVDEARLVTLMVGRQLSSVFKRPERATSTAPAADPQSVPVLRVRGLSSAKLREIDLDVRSGEIVGIAGQAGAGRSTLARALFGVGSHHGTIEVDGTPVVLRSPRDAIHAGIALVPEDRKAQGLVLGASVRDNLTMALWSEISRFGLRSPSERSLAADAIARLRIRTPSPDTPAAALSGGNQQKIVIGKWLATAPRLLLLDEPTRGVDVGAKDEIYRLIDELAASGVGIVVFSSELLELLRLSDRIVVMAAGRVVGEEDGASATEESITRLAFAGLDEMAGAA